MTLEAATLGYFPYIPYEEPSPSEERQRLKFATAEVTTTAGEYTRVSHELEFGRLLAKLKAIRTDSTLWPEGAEAPKQLAIIRADEILRKLEQDMLRPSKIVATAEGGIAICFIEGNVYADIECFNDGTILGVLSDRVKRPLVWEIDPISGDIARAISGIRGFLASSQAETNDPRR